MRTLRSAGLLAAATLISAPGADAQGTVNPGDRPSYTFQSELLNSRGVKSLDDLRGRPVLVEFWGTQ